MTPALAEIEEVRAGMNADFVEQLGDDERFDEGRFWRQRRAIEKKWRDPDDVYIDVRHREEERKKAATAATCALAIWRVTEACEGASSTEVSSVFDRSGEETHSCTRQAAKEAECRMV